MTNLREPPSRASSTFCFSSWRFPTMSCPSTPTTTTPRLSFVRLKPMSALPLEGRRPPPCPQYRRASRAQQRDRVAYALDPRTLGAAARAIGEEGDHGVVAHDAAAVARGGDGGIGELLGRRLRDHRTVGEGQHRVVPHHVEGPAHRSKPRRRADPPKGRADRVA